MDIILEIIFKERERNCGVKFNKEPMKIQKQKQTLKLKKNFSKKNSLLDTGFILGTRKQFDDPLNSYNGGDYNKYSKYSQKKVCVDDGDDDEDAFLDAVDCIECDNVVKPISELKCTIKGCFHQLCIDCFKKKAHPIKTPYICDVCKSESREIKRFNENTFDSKEHLEPLDDIEEEENGDEDSIESISESDDSKTESDLEYIDDSNLEIIDVETDFDSDSDYSCSE